MRVEANYELVGVYAHAARHLHTLSVGYTAMAMKYPGPQQYLSEAARLRRESRKYMELAWREKAYRQSQQSRQEAA